MAAYARQRDERDLAVWVSEIQLRAAVRIGELSRELETAQGARTDKTSSTHVDEVTKAKVLADAGITVPTANRYEHLAGRRDAQAQASATKASHPCRTSTPVASSISGRAVMPAAVTTAPISTDRQGWANRPSPPPAGTIPGPSMSDRVKGA
jgi:hypothetical protein